MIYDDINITMTTERLLLRLFTEADAETVTRLCNDYNIYKSTLTLPYPYTLDCAMSWIEHHQENFDADKLYEFAICDRETGALYGAIALSNHQRYDNGELSYWVGQPFWGNGYATEAAKAILDFAFDVKKYHKVYGICATFCFEPGIRTSNTENWHEERRGTDGSCQERRPL